ncbi:hypothetical protein AVEN_173990-1 [Araneus ventricosus]|uniref:Uncharacterized protein n=1 Tax=Araneus ventricosus TaxID=182803 RepID=A0A4Y2RDQ2_ARAVE|nr:hypothetical protein AVEN_173990-1 [Araneus ventricosus]
MEFDQETSKTIVSLADIRISSKWNFGTPEGKSNLNFKCNIHISSKMEFSGTQEMKKQSRHFKHRAHSISSKWTFEQQKGNNASWFNHSSLLENGIFGHGKRKTNPRF